MKQKRIKISLIKSFICRNADGRQFLSTEYESYLDEIKRLGKENIL